MNKPTATEKVLNQKYKELCAELADAELNCEKWNEKIRLTRQKISDLEQAKSVCEVVESQLLELVNVKIREAARVKEEFIEKQEREIEKLRALLGHKVEKQPEVKFKREILGEWINQEKEYGCSKDCLCKSPGDNCKVAHGIDCPCELCGGSDE